MRVPNPRVSPKIREIVLALVGNGFVLENVLARPRYHLFECWRSDEFGESIPYLFVLPRESLDGPSLRVIKNYRGSSGAHVIVVGSASANVVTINWNNFVARLGGPIRSWLPLEPTYAEEMESLGRNKVPPGLKGKADDLFEEYVHLGLQFMLGDRVIRYGQNRRGEPLPDGVAVSRQDFALLYDAKAAGRGFKVSYQSVRQFRSYVDDFQRRYANYAPPVHAFLVVSADFTDGDETLDARSHLMYAKCRVPLLYLKSAELTSMVALLAKTPSYRSMIDWKAIFSKPHPSRKDVVAAVRSIARDRIARVGT